VPDGRFPNDANTGTDYINSNVYVDFACEPKEDRHLVQINKETQ